MKIEFTPTTMNGQDQPRQPRMSIVTKKKHIIQQVQPAACSANEAVQIFFTRGRPHQPISIPEPRKTPPARSSVSALRLGVHWRFSSSPASTPIRIVPAEETALKVT